MTSALAKFEWVVKLPANLPKKKVSRKPRAKVTGRRLGLHEAVHPIMGVWECLQKRRQKPPFSAAKSQVVSFQR